MLEEFYEPRSTEYEIINTEAGDALELIESPNYSLDGLVELGPQDETFMGAASRLPNELKAMILIEKFLPGPRVIRAIYSDVDEAYTYRCLHPANKLPYVAYGLNSLMAPLAGTIFSPAPWMGMDAYPFFNPNLDTISFEYLSCKKSDDADSNKSYIKAMQCAGKYLRWHAKTPGAAPVRNIKVSWCHNEPIVEWVLNSFRGIPNLDKVTLLAHDHYTGAVSPDDSSEIEEYHRLRLHEFEPRDMRALVSSGELNGSRWPENKEGARILRYPFKVELRDQWGARVLPEESSEDEED
ncbi:hypothetical protein BKA65DRAFT_303624 [Rhexocercosporidium sp. MPI-PUGE-AT-0058]|nr:hypothetical protein BKA65DRAFT_303624 [Rhexocercosporidium sp. MPI-PUGE-AT-0058]